MDMTPQETIAYIGRMLFERRLTDFAGGNISLRVGDEIFISPRHSGAKQHWNIDPQTVVHGSILTGEVLDHPSFSREGKAHLEVYRAFPAAAAIIHAHPFYVMPFCSAGRPIEPVLEATDKFGTVEVLPYAPAHSAELAAVIRDGIRPKEELISRFAAPILLARHGIFVVSGDIDRCLDTVERISWNAWCILARGLLPPAALA